MSSLWCFVMQCGLDVGELCIFFWAEQSVECANVGTSSKGEGSFGAQTCQAAIRLHYYRYYSIALLLDATTGCQDLHTNNNRSLQFGWPAFSEPVHDNSSQVPPLQNQLGTFFVCFCTSFCGRVEQGLNLRCTLCAVRKSKGKCTALENQGGECYTA